MRQRLGIGLTSVGVLAAASMPAIAAVEREDIIVLRADGHHYSVYKTLRSDLAQRVLYLPADESMQKTLFVVPPQYQATPLPGGGTRLHFDGGDFALMQTGTFDDEIRRDRDGDYVFHSWNGDKRADGHFGKWNAPGDFDSFAYSWVVPSNIHVVSYHANRKGHWKQLGNTLAWHGEHVNDITFTIRYRIRPATQVAEAPASAAPAPARPTPKTTPSRPPELSAAHRARLARLPMASAPAGTLTYLPDLAPARAQAPATPPAATENGTHSATNAPAKVLLDSVVVLADGRPRITAHGHLELDRLADAINGGKASQISVTGPRLADTRNMGGSAAKAARVADYLGAHGLDAHKIVSTPGDLKGPGDPSQVQVEVIPGNALGAFRAGN